MIRFYRFPASTNVERVALALAHKRLPVESIVIDPAERSEVRRVSGQDLVPVIVDGSKVVSDSMTIVSYLEEAYPDAPRLYPSVPSRRAEVDIFIDWFNRVWKRAPNALAEQMAKAAAERDQAAVEVSERAMQDALDTFERMLDGREHLMGEFGAADIAAFPFVKYARIPEEGLSYLFHKALARAQRLGEGRPNLASWIERVDARPRV